MAESGAPETLRLEGVRKSYNTGTPTEIEVLHGIDLVLRHGEFAALVGPSGGGKSTLLNVVGLLDPPDGGRIFIAGQETSALDDAERTRLRGRSIGFVFQYHYLLPAFTAIENVMMPALAARGRPDDEMRDAAAALLDKVGLTPWRDSRATEISGGQQQRVAVARALAMKPGLVLADEPTGNLDTRSADGVFDLLREVNETSATTFLIVTHDPRLAQRCDRIIELVDGRIVSDRPNPDVVRHSLTVSANRVTA
ncbi:MAG: ABC transporter ATP-binding protein [Burkholderiales bacterium]